jgi:hypothetical protein
MRAQMVRLSDIITSDARMQIGLARMPTAREVSARHHYGAAKKTPVAQRASHAILAPRPA